jgi:hypothetical protein
MSFKRLLATLLILCGSLFAQSVGFNNTFTATGNSASFAVANGGVNIHKLSYITTGGPASVNIQMSCSVDGTTFALVGSALTSTTSGETYFSGVYRSCRIALATLTGGTSPTVIANYTGVNNLLYGVTTSSTTGSASTVQGQCANGAAASGCNPFPSAWENTLNNIERTRINTGAPADGDSNSYLGFYSTAQGAMLKQEVRPALSSNLNGTFTWDRYRSVIGYRLVSATNTANTQVIDAGNLIGSLSVHTSCSAGTASLTVDVSVDNTNFLNVDTIAAAAQIVKVYNSTTVGGAATTSSAGALAPLSFRYIKLTQASCGVGNTGTMNASVKGS